jgi:hypothetical protein
MSKKVRVGRRTYASGVWSGTTGPYTIKCRLPNVANTHSEVEGRVGVHRYAAVHRYSAVVAVAYAALLQACCCAAGLQLQQLM